MLSWWLWRSFLYIKLDHHFFFAWFQLLCQWLRLITQIKRCNGISMAYFCTTIFGLIPKLRISFTLFVWFNSIFQKLWMVVGHLPQDWWGQAPMSELKCREGFIRTRHIEKTSVLRHIVDGNGNGTILIYIYINLMYVYTLQLLNPKDKFPNLWGWGCYFGLEKQCTFKSCTSYS